MEIERNGEKKEEERKKRKKRDVSTEICWRVRGSRSFRERERIILNQVHPPPLNFFSSSHLKRRGKEKRERERDFSPPSRLILHWQPRNLRAFLLLSYPRPDTLSFPFQMEELILEKQKEREEKYQREKKEERNRSFDPSCIIIIVLGMKPLYLKLERRGKKFIPW